MVIFDDLKIKRNVEFPGKYEAPASYSSLQKPKRSKPTPRVTVKGDANGMSSNISTELNNSSTYKIDKDNGKIGGDGGLPPIWEN